MAMVNLYRFFFLFILLLLIQFTGVYAQTITLSQLPNSPCSDTPISITVTVTGIYSPGNIFALQARSDYSGNQYTLIPFTQNGRVITFRFPSSLIVRNEQSYSVRLISSAPVVESDWTNYVRVNVPATVRLAGVASAISNPYDPFLLQFQATGTPPITATLSDSSQLTLNDYYGNVSFAATLPFYASRTDTYKLVTAKNVCGPGQANGEVALTVNPFNLRTLSAAPAIVCRGGTLHVSYSKSSGDFGPTNRFRVRLTAAYPNSVYQPPNSPVYTLDATADNGILQVIIPDSLKGGANNLNTFSVAVVTTDPVVVGQVGGVYVELRPRASVEINTPSATISYGETVNFSLQFQGKGPYSATLSDGSIVTSTDGIVTPITLKPRQTTTYRVERFQSACSPTSIPPSSMLVVVNPAIAIDSIFGQKKTYCEGQTARIKFSTNATFGGETQFTIVLNRTTGSWVSQPIPARRESGDVLAFDIPTLDGNTSSDSRYYALTIRASAPAVRSIPYPYALQINTKPTFARFSDNSRNTILQSPGIVYLYVDTNGGGPYQLVVNDGKSDKDLSWAGWPTVEATVFNNTAYTLRSISNTCGTLENPGTTAVVTVNKPAPAQIWLNPVTEYRCETDSINATFDTAGDFLPGNVFRVQVAESILGYGYGWSDVKIGGQNSASPVRFKVPNSSKIRIVSTNPVTISNERSAPAGYRLNAVLKNDSYYRSDLYGTPYQTLIPGESISLPIEVNSPAWTGPYSLTYTDGARTYTYQGSNWNAIQESLKLSQTTTFRIVRVNNVCGDGLTKGEATFAVVPFRIKTLLPPYFNDYKTYVYSVCSGGSLSVPFITDVAAPTGTVYALQIATQKDSVFSDLVSGTSSPLLARIPAAQSAGDYWLRIVAKGTEVRTIPMAVRVQQLPTATLRPPVSGTSIAAGESFRPSVTLTGSAPWTILFSDNSTGQYYTSPALPDFRPTKGITYAIRSVTNVCGYGPVSGEAAVKVKAALSIQRQTYSEDCVGGVIPITYSSVGDFGQDNRLTVELLTSQGVFLRNLAQLSNSSGQTQLTLPNDLLPGLYQVNLRASNPSIGAASPIYVTLKTPPTITLSGSTTINTGQSVFLSIRNNQGSNGTDQITYRLSDGTVNSLTLTGREPTSLQVYPTQTTSYSIVTVSGGCGVGSSRGVATVTVNSGSGAAVSTGVLAKMRYCTGEKVSVPFSVSGLLNPTNRFQVQLIDSTGKVVQNVSTTATTSPLSITLANDLAEGDGYRLRVTASDPTISSGASPYTMQIHHRAAAAFDSPVYVRQPGQSVRLTVQFSGQGPWYYTMNSDLYGPFSGTASDSPFQFMPAKDGNTYTLLSVSNSTCGSGDILSPASIQVTLLTATEPPLAMDIRISPNPTDGLVRVIMSSVPKMATIQLTDVSGHPLIEQRVKSQITELSLQAYPVGTYLLTIDNGDQRNVYRLVRN